MLLTFYLLGLCFSTETELEEKAEYEKVAHPDTLQEMMALNEQQKRVKAERLAKREATLATNVSKLAKWTEDLVNKRGKKEEEGETFL